MTSATTRRAAAHNLTAAMDRREAATWAASMYGIQDEDAATPRSVVINYSYNTTVTVVFTAICIEYGIDAHAASTFGFDIIINNVHKVAREFEIKNGDPFDAATRIRAHIKDSFRMIATDVRPLLADRIISELSEYLPALARAVVIHPERLGI